MYLVRSTYDYSVDMWAVGELLYNLYNNGKTAYVTSHVHFTLDYFEDYQKSFTLYLSQLCGTKMLTKGQYETVYKEKFQGNHTQEPIREIVQRCFVPLPSNGTEDFPVTRQITESRLTLDEVLKWTESNLVGWDELSCHNTVIKHVKESYRL